MTGQWNKFTCQDRTQWIRNKCSGNDHQRFIFSDLTPQCSWPQYGRKAIQKTVDQPRCKWKCKAMDDELTTSITILPFPPVKPDPTRVEEGLFYSENRYPCPVVSLVVHNDGQYWATSWHRIFEGPRQCVRSVESPEILVRIYIW